MVVASFHLARFPASAAAARLAAVPVDRRALRRAPGLRFGRLLGTGAGRTMTMSADLRRWALFAVWDDDAARHHFLTDHPLSLAWDDGADERFDVALDPIGGRGSWDGVDYPLAGGGRPEPHTADVFVATPTGRPAAAPDGDSEPPIAVLTRATVRWRQVPSFLRAVPAVDRHLAGVDGLLEMVGIGELPVGRQATFSLWRDAVSMRDFAYRAAAHTEVIGRTRAERWYGEEWFARFRPRDATGTWDGRRPL